MIFMPFKASILGLNEHFKIKYQQMIKKHNMYIK